MVRRIGRNAYLLVTFDLLTQKIASTDEIVGPLESYKVIVDWNQLCKLVNAREFRDDDPDPEPPWRRMAFEEEDDHRERPPWTGGADDVERPPEV